MKFLNKLMNIIIIALLMSFTSCQQEKYPDLKDGLYAEFVTNKGIMVAQLAYNKTPVTVANFVSLAEGTNTHVDSIYKGKKFYNGIIFHRVIDKFMIQGGDPTGTGSGSPGYRFADEFHPDLKHDKPGILSMANSGPSTNGSQFFITEVPTPNLDNKHTVFGELILGLNILDSISNVKKGERDKPIEDVVIQELNIIRKGEEANSFDAPKVYDEELPKIVERQKALKEEQQKLAEEKAKVAKQTFINNNKEIGVVKELATGVVMIYTNQSNGEKPSSVDKVLIDYAGFFENGKLFDTSWADVAKEYGQYDEARDQKGGYKPFPMIYNETAGLVPGFREAMLNMNVGDKARVFIPSYLGYGERGAGGVIPPNANLIFNLEIVGIVE